MKMKKNSRLSRRHQNIAIATTARDHCALLCAIEEEIEEPLK